MATCGYVTWTQERLRGMPVGHQCGQEAEVDVLVLAPAPGPNPEDPPVVQAFDRLLTGKSGYSATLRWLCMSHARQVGLAWEGTEVVGSSALSVP